MATGSSSGEKKIQQMSAVPKNDMPHRPISIQMMQNVLLVWLDSNIDDTSEDYRNTITQLRDIVNDITQYTDGDQCIQFIETITNNKVCMIVSGALGQHIVPRVHNMSQMDSIFIFCGNKTWHEQWAKEWPKIKGVFTKITPICEALKQTADQCEQNAISISFMATTTTGASNKTSDRLDPSFMYTQILKEILLVIEFEKHHIKEFVEYCRKQFAGNQKELAKVKQLQRQYREKPPIYWYTCEGFLYPMLNVALRLMNVDVIVRMGFFIGDLHRQIEQLHSEEFGSHSTAEKFTVYRGQSLSKADFEQMKKTKGGLMSFNNFLSTSKHRKVSLRFANDATKNSDLVDILFIMKIDPSQSTTPFASISAFSDFKEEDEVLFSMHSVFRITDIKPMNGNNPYFEVNLAFTNDNDEDLRALTNRIRAESFPDAEGWERLGSMLLKMGQSDKAEEVYNVLLNQTTHESENAHIYHQLGWVKHNQGEYEKAIEFYKKSLAIYQKTLLPNHPDLGTSHFNIGSSYYSMCNYAKALSSYEKALEIRQQSLSLDHPDLAKSYGNIGMVYDSLGDYPKALSSHKKAFQIYKKSLPPNHPDLGASYDNIGNVYQSMNDYPTALSYHKKALEIQQISLPSNHPDLGGSYLNIGSVYYSMSDYPTALSHYGKALEIRQRSLHPNHPDLGTSYSNIGMVYGRMVDYPKALSYYEKSLEIRQKSLPLNHPDLGDSYHNIGSVHYNMDNYSKARPYYERAVEIGEQSLSPTHPTLQQRRKNLEDVKKKL